MDIKERKFELREGDEFIELHKLLQILGVAQTGGHAKMIINDNLVEVNGELETRKRKKLRPGDLMECVDVKIRIA